MQRVEALGLVAGEAARGLVEDDDPRALAHRGRDLHHLLLAHGEVAHQRAHVDLGGDVREHRPGAAPPSPRSARSRRGRAARPGRGSRPPRGSRRRPAPGGPCRCRRASASPRMRRSARAGRRAAPGPRRARARRPGSCPSVLLPAPFSPHSAWQLPARHVEAHVLERHHAREALPTRSNRNAGRVIYLRRASGTPRARR